MPKTCPQCQSEASDAATFCPSCGASLAPAAATGAPPPGASEAPSAKSSVPAFRFDAARWTLADRIAGIATVVLFISLFLSWYTYSIAGFNFTADGLWHGWMYLTLILCIAIVGYLVMRAGWDRLPISSNLPHMTVMMAATIVNLVLVVIAFLDKPGGGGVGWGFGAFVGLIAALAAAAPYTIPKLRERTGAHN
jgi:zinc-ribbon domain